MVEHGLSITFGTGHDYADGQNNEHTRIQPCDVTGCQFEQGHFYDGKVTGSHPTAVRYNIYLTRRRHYDTIKIFWEFNTEKVERVMKVGNDYSALENTRICRLSHEAITFLQRAKLIRTILEKRKVLS